MNIELKKFINLRTVSSVLIGAAAGFGYYYFVGCKSGSCPITGSPYISTLYGAVMGLVFILPSGKKKENADESHN